MTYNISLSDGVDVHFSSAHFVVEGEMSSVIHVASLAGNAPPQASRVAVLKAVGHRPDMPYIAVVTHGFPRLTTLNAELLLPTHDGHELPFGVRVLVRDDTAVIPDLEQLESTLSEMLAAG